eukprot:6272918-Heterocapsa_arctica.AAC.1
MGKDALDKEQEALDKAARDLQVARDSFAAKRKARDLLQVDPASLELLAKKLAEENAAHALL